MQPSQFDSVKPNYTKGTRNSKDVRVGLSALEVIDCLDLDSKSECVIFSGWKCECTQSHH